MSIQNDTIKIVSSKGYISIVDVIDSDLALLKWCNSKLRFRRIDIINGKRQHHNLHRDILERKLGRTLTKGEECDHVNGDVLDNRRCNLRLATREQNNQNRKRMKNNTSGYKGVCPSKKKGKWRAYITAYGKRNIALGDYDTPELAYIAYCNKANELHGEFAKLE